MGVRGVPADAGRHRRTSSRGHRPRSAGVIATRDEGERGSLALAVVRSGVVQVSRAAVVRAQSGPPRREDNLLPLLSERAITKAQQGTPKRAGCRVRRPPCQPLDPRIFPSGLRSTIQSRIHRSTSPRRPAPRPWRLSPGGEPPTADPQTSRDDQPFQSLSLHAAPPHLLHKNGSFQGPGCQGSRARVFSQGASATRPSA